MPIAAAKDLTDCSLFNRLVEGLLKPATELVLRQGWALLVLLPENDFLSIAESVPFRWDWSSEVRKYYDKFHYFLRAKNHGRSAQYSQKSLTICLLIDNVQQPGMTSNRSLNEVMLKRLGLTNSMTAYSVRFQQFNELGFRQSVCPIIASPKRVIVPEAPSYVWKQRIS